MKNKLSNLIIVILAITLVTIISVQAVSAKYKKVNEAVYYINAGYTTILDGKQITAQDKLSIPMSEVSSYCIHIVDEAKTVYLFTK